MEIRSESNLFEGRNFCYLDFVFDSVFAVFRYGTHACRSKIAKSANLIKFAIARERLAQPSGAACQIWLNLTRKLAEQTLALVKFTQKTSGADACARQIYSNIKNGASSTFLIILNGERSASCRICVEYCGFCSVPRTLMTVESVRSLPSTI